MKINDEIFLLIDVDAQNEHRILALTLQFASTYTDSF